MRGRVVLGFALAATALLSLAVWPAPPGYDAWLWLSWGRDLAHLSLDTDPGVSGVAWKPLPALLAAPISLAGSAAPELWVVLVRFCAFTSLLLAFRIGTRIAGRIAGAVAVGAMLLLPDLWGVTGRADSEPILIALALVAIELHLAGNRRLAFAAIFGAALIRPEVWPFLGLYALVLWREDRRARPALAAAIAAVPMLWFGLDWLGSGDALTGPGTARGADERTSAGEALANVVEALPAPLWVLVALAVGYELRATAGATLRERIARPALLITAIAFAWLAAVFALGTLGYIGSERFVVAPACLLCPVAGAGAAWAIAPFEGRWRLVVAAVLVALAIPLVVRQAERTDARFGDLAVRESDALADVISRSDGSDAVLACRGPIRIEDTRWLPRLIYELETQAERVGVLVSVPNPPDSEGPQVIFVRREGLAAFELYRAIGSPAVAPLGDNEAWSAYAIACNGGGPSG